MKVSIYVATSLDGFIARENGDLDWLPGSDGEMGNEDLGYRDFMDSVDVLVMGRKTYEKVLSFGMWPYGEKHVVVLCSSLTQVPAEIAKTVEIRSGAPTELVKELERSGAKHIYVDGGKTIQSFLSAGLIQEIIITRVPVLIGSGISLFGDLARDIRLCHIKTTSYESGLVQSTYMVIN
jgi:dihydrofolate reductase